MIHPLTIVAPQLGLEVAARSVLDSLPAWFGIPEANDEYIDFVADHPTWSATDSNGVVIGLLAPHEHAQSSEIHLLAVRPEWHRRGVGRALVEAFEADAMRRGVPLAQVKTLGPSNSDAGYAKTRQFYAALGYLELEEMIDLWPGTPALVMVKPLTRKGGEAAVIALTTTPITQAMITAALTDAGVGSGSVIIVHSSMSALGWIAGDAHAVVNGLLDAVGPAGTIVMPAHTGLSDPSDWANPPVPTDWVELFHANAPPFDPNLTPMRGMGRIAESFARLPTARHSGHPNGAFVASGPLADRIVATHPLPMAFGDESPLGALYELDAWIVLIGVGHGNNTSLHLSEHRAEYAGKHLIHQGVPTIVDGERQWVTFDDLALDVDDFPTIGAAYSEAGGDVNRVPLGNGWITACRMRGLVDFAVEWMEQHRVASSD